MNDNPKKIARVTLGVIVITGLIIALLYNREVKKTNYTPPSFDNSVDAESHKQYATDDKSESYIISQDFVKKCVLYPSETEFIEPYGYIHEIIGQNECTVIAKFVTKNTYGVKIDFVYKIWLSHNGDEWEDINNWQCQKLIIESANTGETKVYNNVQ
jgi:hypothetical protein